jgi:DNA replication protein DnaC
MTSGIPAEYLRVGFGDYRPYNDSLMDAVHIALKYAADYPVVGERTDPPGLLFIGPAGVGKTHLAACILTTVIESTGMHGLFYKTRDLLRLMRNSYNPAIQTTEQQILDPILTCDLLVLDDLGAERLTEWVADTMELIIDTRYTARRATIATTNFPDLDDPQDPNGLQCRVEFRTYSRLQSMCRFVTLAGADYRAVDPSTSEADLRRISKTRRPHLPGRSRGGRPVPTPHDGKADLKWPGGKGGNT